MSQKYDFRETILREFELRKNRNSRYSLRAYARDLGLQAPKLSQILKGTCGLSRSRGAQIAKHLNLSAEEKKLFLFCLEARFSRSALLKSRAQKSLEQCLDQVYLAIEQFRLIADWYHFAILELVKLPLPDFSIATISSRLGIEPAKAEAALKRLENLKLITRDGAQIKASDETISTTTDIPSRDIREHHRQVLQKATNALETVDVLERDFSTMILAVRSEQLPEAKAMIDEFKNQFDLRFGKTESPDRVYALGIQLFPLDQNPQTKKKQTTRSLK